MSSLGFYISDPAYNQLTYFAQKYGYVEWGSKRANGISQFLNDLAVMEFNDTRPFNTRQRHAEEIALGRAPLWRTHRSKRLRLLDLTEDTIQLYFAVAFRFQIISDEPYVVGNLPSNTPLPAVAAVLEGIGLQWITPDQWPMKVRG